MTRQVHVVPHTHWDREWYEPFQTFRARLVGLLDELLPRLERDPSYSHFMLDGQMAVVDDHLEVRPEATAALHRLASSGRLAMGPWYVLMDEFLVSGETIVRNLQLGRARAAEFGGAMEVGYLPDMFGHIAQMPQILRQFGLEHAVVWRGTPSAVDRTGFWWQAPDGSTVRAEYLPQGYGNGAALPDDAKDLVERIREFHATHEELIADAPILWMNGTDHQMPFPTLGTVISAANELQDDYHLTVTSLAEHVRRAPADGLPTWTGELRSGARANLLMGVASNRVDVKQAAARAERTLERMAEPLAAMVEAVGIGEWPQRFLDMAWRNVILDSAHDSVCACSVDEVCEAVLVRYAEAQRLGEAIVDSALATLGKALPGDDVVVVNTVARQRAGMVELEVPAGPPRGEAEQRNGQLVQVIGETSGRAVLHRVPRRHAATVVERELDIHLGVHGVDLEVHDDGEVDVTIHSDPADRSAPTFGWAVRRLRELAVERPDGVVQVWLRRPPTQRILVRTPAVPGLGWTPWEPVADVDPVVVSADGLTLSNGLATVVVDPATGTFELDGHAGLGRLVEDGDEGDTYNHSPPQEQVVVDAPLEVRTEVEERGPLRAGVTIASTYRWPERAVLGARVGERLVTVRTRLELHAGERMVRVETELDNVCRDHRVRVWFPLTEPAATSTAECAFATVERGLNAEGGDTERGLPTFPSRRFVQAGELTVAHEGLLEYELADVRGEADAARAHSLALTLLRCTGWLSRPPMEYRPLPAGPVVETPGAQMPGRQVARWAVAVGDVDPYEMVDDVFTPLLTTRGGGRGAAPTTARLADVTGAEVSAVIGGRERTTIRVFNPRSEAITVDLNGRRAWLEDLGGRPLAPVDGTFELGPWRIATVSLEPQD